MRIKFTLIALAFLLFKSSLLLAQIEVKYFRCDNSYEVPVNKPITIIYQSAIQDTSGQDLDVINLAKYIAFEAEGNNIEYSAFNEKPNQITIIPYLDMVPGQKYSISVNPLRYKESGELTESFQCEFTVDRNTYHQTVETAYLNSFSFLMENFARMMYPADTLKILATYLLPENLSYLGIGQNQAERMKGVGRIFDCMARNPELQDEILIQSVNSLGYINDIMPISEEAEAERMNALASLLGATARRPEIADTLNLLADTLLGVPEDFSVLGNEVKVARMKSLSEIFNAIARQPEAFRTLLNQGLRYHGAIQLLGTTTSEAEAERMLALSSLFEATARQPEAYDSLNLAADTLLGIPEDFAQFDDQVLAVRMKSLSTLFESAARQPEMADSMRQQAVRYMGRFQELNELDSLSERERMASLGSLWEGMARQPEASEKMCSMVDTLMGIPEDFSTLSNLGKVGRMKGFNNLFEAMARQPEITDSLLSKAIRFCGTEEQVGELSESAQSYRMYIFKSFFEAIARQPEIWKKFDLTADTLLGIPENFASLNDFIHKGRIHAINGLFASIARQPTYCDTLLMLAEKYLGTYEQVKPVSDELRFVAVGTLVESILRQFEYADTLDLAAEFLIGVPDSFNDLSDDAIGRRSQVVEYLLDRYPETNEKLDYVLSIVYKYLGKWAQITKENKFSHMARMNAAGSLFERIQRSPEKTSEYIAVFDTLLGITEDFSILDKDVRHFRHKALYSFNSIYLSNIGSATTDSLVKAAREVLGTNTDCPVQSWSEAEIRMEALSYLFERHSYRPIDKESLEEWVTVIEEFSGNPNVQFSNSNKVNYFRQKADGYLTSWLMISNIHDTITNDVRERLLGAYTPEKPILYGAPSQGSVNVPVGYEIHLLFTDNMYSIDSVLLSRTSIKDSIKLVTVDNEPVPFVLDVYENNRTVKIVPVEELTHGAQYKLIVPACFINFDDSLSNSLSNQFRVEKAILKVIAENKEINEGDAIPELTMIFEGFVDDDTEDDITKPEIATDAISNSAPGIYPIILSGGSSDKYDFDLTNGSLNIIETTGINFDIENYKVKLYPNPVSDVLCFEMEKVDLQITDVEIINHSGQVVFSKQVKNNKSNIDVSMLPNGLYIVLFKTDNESTVSCKIVKQ